MALIRDERRKSTKSLGRSDSYRKAKPLLSPAEARKNRNSVEVGALDISSINLGEKSAAAAELKKEPKNNFFRNIRNQLSFSSLRRKSPKKSSFKDDSYRHSGSDPAKEIGDLSPASGARMTSTPLGCTAVRASEGPEEVAKKPEGVTRRTEGAVGGVTRRTEGGSDVKFRTAALKNQHQRWSFAEQSNQGTVQYRFHNFSMAELLKVNLSL